MAANPAKVTEEKTNKSQWIRGCVKAEEKAVFQPEIRLYAEEVFG